MYSIICKKLQYTSQNSSQFLFLSIPQDSLQGSRHWKIKNKKFPREIASLTQEKQMTCEAGWHVVRHMTAKCYWILAMYSEHFWSVSPCQSTTLCNTKLNPSPVSTGGPPAERSPAVISCWSEKQWGGKRSEEGQVTCSKSQKTAEFLFMFAEVRLQSYVSSLKTGI